MPLGVLPSSLTHASKESVWSPQENSEVISKKFLIVEVSGGWVLLHIPKISGSTGHGLAG